MCIRDSALTGAQRRVFEEIRADLARPVPMLRLVQGDVGSGKTVVAALAAEALKRLGFDRPISLAGGWLHWVESGGAVEGAAR